MARYSPTVPIFSSKVSIPRFEISDAQWVILSADYAGDLSAGLRGALEKNCRYYLQSREAELHSDAFSEAVTLVEEGKAAADAFYDLAHRLLDNGKDSGTFASSRLEDFFTDKAVRINPAHLLVVEDESTEWESPLGPEAEFPLHLRMSRELLRRVAAELQFAFIQTRAALKMEENNGASFTPGRAFVEFADRCTASFKSENLAVGPTSGGKPSKFSHLMFKLHAMLPTEFREPQMLSAGAMAQRIRRSREGDK